jgi:hypothetical protein
MVACDGQERSLPRLWPLFCPRDRIRTVGPFRIFLYRNFFLSHTLQRALIVLGISVKESR